MACILQALTAERFADDATVQAAACWALGAFCKDEQVRLLILSSGGKEAAAAAALRLQSNPKVTNNAKFAIHKMVKTEPSQGTAGRGGAGSGTDGDSSEDEEGDEKCVVQ